MVITEPQTANSQWACTHKCGLSLDGGILTAWLKENVSHDLTTGAAADRIKVHTKFEQHF